MQDTPLSVGLNSSAVFQPVQDLRLCTNKPYIIDHSAADPDGDSLSYELCETHLGGDPNDPKPKITHGSLPVFNQANYIFPFSFSNPMNGLTINPMTGQLAINTNPQGAYLVTVCCHEWRNGIMINTIRRSYTYRVENCNFSVLPVIACDSNTVEASSSKTCLAHCNDKTITFVNKSFGALAYHWDFGVTALSNDTSSLAAPTFTYPDTGRYKVTLIAYGSTCTDSIIEYVNIYEDELIADFDFTGGPCIGDSIQFTSNTSSLNDTINYFKWRFINGNTALSSYQQNPLMRFEVPGTFHVVLSVFNQYGCYAMKEKEFSLSSLHVVAYKDTSVPIHTTVYLDASGAETYHWDLYKKPSGSLPFFSNIKDPLVTETIPGVYWFIVTGTNSDGCIGKDTAKIVYTPEVTYFVPTAFSPNGDHVNDEIRLFLSGFKLIYFKIFNRRGQEVFYSNDVNKGWDGTFKGSDLGIDSYFWVACVKDIEERKLTFSGTFVLVR